MPHRSFVYLAGLAVCALSSPLNAQDRYATGVVGYVQGPGTGIFVPDNVLGGPEGAGLAVGSLDVLTLGVGGSVTLGFDVTLTDGPGADFTVFENGFLSGGDAFAEVVFVEVSTDGVTFARFPSSYGGPPGPVDTVPMATYSGLAGGMPVLANVTTGGVDPFDPVESGGESFDLADLQTSAPVQGGQVDLEDIHFVRLIDVVAGIDVDTDGDPIWDSGGVAGNADIDAVAVLNWTAGASPSQPIADVFLDAGGFLHVRLGDPDGFFDLDFSTLRTSFSLIEFPFTVLFSGVFALLSFDGAVLHLVSTVPIPGTGTVTPFSISVRDIGGSFCGDQIMLQG